MAEPRVLCGRTCHMISKFLGGSMLELVGHPQSYYAPEPSGEDFGVNRDRSKCAYRSLHKICVWDQPNVYANTVHMSHRGLSGPSVETHTTFM